MSQTRPDSSGFSMDYEKAVKVLPLGLSLFMFLALVLGALFLPSKLGPTPHNWFSDYALALSQGRLYVGEGTQWRDCKWDQSFFEGKCYLYFGIVPALFHWFLPFVSNRLFSIFGVAFFTYFFSKLLLQLSGFRSKDPVDWFLSSLLILSSVCASSFIALGLCSRVYEEAICFAHTFGMGGVFLGLPVLFDQEEQGSSTHLWLTSFFFTLASLSRATWFPVFFIFCIMVLVKQQISRKQPLFSLQTLPPFLGLGLALGFQGWLNNSRFHSFTDFGVNYVSSTIRYEEQLKSGYGLFSWRFIIPNFTSYYFIRFIPSGGGFVLRGTEGWLQGILLKNVRFLESPHTLSLTCFGSFLCFLQGRAWWDFCKKVWPVVVLISPLALINLSQDSIIYRYQLEVSLPFFLVSIPFLISISNKMSQKLFLITTLASLVGIGFSIANSLEATTRFWKVL